MTNPIDIVPDQEIVDKVEAGLTEIWPELLGPDGLKTAIGYRWGELIARVATKYAQAAFAEKTATLADELAQGMGAEQASGAQAVAAAIRREMGEADG